MLPCSPPPCAALPVQDEGQRAKTGLSAAKLELDARPLLAEHIGKAMGGNQKVGLAAALLEVRFIIAQASLHCSLLTPC